MEKMEKWGAKQGELSVDRTLYVMWKKEVKKEILLVGILRFHNL